MYYIDNNTNIRDILHYYPYKDLLYYYSMELFASPPSFTL